LAKPGLSGFSSNSSAQTEQIFMGKAIYIYDTTLVTLRGSGPSSWFNRYIFVSDFEQTLTFNDTECFE
jgi:hypothetical protein